MVKRYITRARILATSATAKDTLALFAGNLISAFFSFLFTLVVARGLSIPDFGIFSAVINLFTMITSFSDLGVSSGMVNFVAQASAQKKERLALKYIKGSLIIKIASTSFVNIFILIFAKLVSTKLLATEDVNMAYWVVGLSTTLIFWGIFVSVLQAQKKFIKSIIVDLSLVIPRFFVVLVLFIVGGLNLAKVFGSYVSVLFMPLVIGLVFIGTAFLFVRVGTKIYKELLGFSGWLGVNRIISSISGKIDIQMLAVMAGATTTGLYSISAKLAMFIAVLTSSFSSVLAPRLASFGNKEKEKIYIKKAALFTVPVILGIIVWIIFAEPFITILFGQKYMPAVPVFRALAASMIPILLSAPAVSAIIYAMKKPIYIGAFSFFQIVAVFLINFLLIPRIGAFAPTVAFGFVYTILAIYVWAIVIKHYRANS